MSHQPILPTFIIVLLMGLPVYFSVFSLENPAENGAEIREMQQASRGGGKREPSSEKSAKKPATSVIQMKFGCAGWMKESYKLNQRMAQIKATLCPQFGSLLEINNLTNSTSAAVFKTGPSQIETDLISFNLGKNELQLISNVAGKKLVHLIRVDYQTSY